MKIYTAARYSRMEEMRGIRDRLVAAGHEVTAQWVDGAEETLEESAAGAEMDIDDIIQADALMFFSEPKGSLNRGGGRHWEFGFAYGLNRRCIVIGELETIFCHLKYVRRYESLDDFLR